jgi:hypothetical protein
MENCTQRSLKQGSTRFSTTMPSFWRRYHNAQLKVVSFCMGSTASGVVREASNQELIADFGKTKGTGCCSFCQRG